MKRTTATKAETVNNRKGSQSSLQKSVSRVCKLKDTTQNEKGLGDRQGKCKLGHLFLVMKFLLPSVGLEAVQGEEVPNIAGLSDKLINWLYLASLPSDAA